MIVPRSILDDGTSPPQNACIAFNSAIGLGNLKPLADSRSQRHFLRPNVRTTPQLRLQWWAVAGMPSGMPVFLRPVFQPRYSPTTPAWKRGVGMTPHRSNTSWLITSRRLLSARPDPLCPAWDSHAAARPHPTLLSSQDKTP